MYWSRSQTPDTTITAFGRLEVEWDERKILLGWLELVAGLWSGVRENYCSS